MKTLIKEEIENKSKRELKTNRGNTAVLGMAHWAPEKEISLAEVDKTITEKTSVDLRLEKLTGVARRRMIKPSTTVLDMAMKAVDKLLEDFPLEIRDEIDLVIYCGVTREYVEPATATLIHEKVGLGNATAFDVTDACLGFVDGMFIADAMIGSGAYSKALLVSAEIGSMYAEFGMERIAMGDDPRNHFASLTLGDGACAYLMGSAATAPVGAPVFKVGTRASYGEFSDLCIIAEKNIPMKTRPAELFGAALSKMPELVHSVLDECGWGIGDVDLYVPHQASLRAIEKGARSLGVKPEQICNSLQEYGNMASVSLPFTFSQAMANAPVQAGTRTLLVGFGSGLGVGVIALENAGVEA